MEKAFIVLKKYSKVNVCLPSLPSKENQHCEFDR